ncbi:MAG: hypothetical protein U1F26_09975 [Lysobacterales bacterium]
MRPLLALIALLLTACGEAPPPAAPPPPAPPPVLAPPVPEQDLYKLLVGGSGFHAEMGLAGLRQRFGADQVVEAPVPLGEGSSEPGAVIYPNDPSRRAYVYLVDGKADGKLSAIYVRDPDSRWRGPLDLKIGMSSTELDQLNGRPFRFLGFDWDYGGYVSNWAEGVLATALLAPGHLAVRLAPPALAEGEERAADYPAGDSEFPSDLPSVRAQPPVVVEFGVAFGP